MKINKLILTASAAMLFYSMSHCLAVEQIKLKPAPALQRIADKAADSIY